MCSVRCGPRGVWLSGATLLTTMATGAANLRSGGTNNILTVELHSVEFACVSLSGTTSHPAVGTQY